MKFLATLTALFAIASASQTEALAQAKKEEKKSSLEQSKKFKVSKDKTKVDFDDANIEGQAKNPFGTLLNSRNQDFNRGFIKLRYDWHDHMMISASGMSQ